MMAFDGFEKRPSTFAVRTRLKPLANVAAAVQRNTRSDGL